MFRILIAGIVMRINSLLNGYCRKVGPILMVLLPLIILYFMILGNFLPTANEMKIAALFWTLLLLNAFSYLINGLFIRRSFKTETRMKAEAGFPVDSLEGYSAVTNFTTQVLLNSTIIALVIFLSWILILIVVLVIPFLQVNEDINTLVTQILGQDFSAIEGVILRPILIFSAIGLVLIAIGILLLLKIPEKPSFEVGAFLKFYYPQQTPIILDNLLSDAILAFLDPITKMHFDEWTELIDKSLNVNYEPEVEKKTRVERAREKILLLFYIKQRMPLLLTEEVFLKELLEVISSSQMPEFLAGGTSGINLLILNDIFNQLTPRIPEIFKMIDRLIIELTDNLGEFLGNNDIWANIAAPEKVVGNENPFRILSFTLNKDVSLYSNRKRSLNFQLSAPTNHYMENLNISLAADEAEDFLIDKIPLPFISEGSQDILGLLTRILQIGDAVWFTVERKSFDSHLFHLAINEGARGSIFGETIAINVTRDLMFYIRTYGGKLSALSGLLLPIGSIILQYLLP